MIAVIAEDHHDGVFSQSGVFQRGENPPDLLVDEAGRRQIRMNHIAPLAVLLNFIQAVFRQLPVQIPRKTRQIGALARFNRRQDAVVVRIKIPPLLRHINRHMRQMKSGGDKKRLPFGSTANLLHCPGGRFIIGFIFVAMREYAPVDNLVGQRINQPVRRLVSGSSFCFTNVIKFNPLLLSAGKVVNLARRRCPVTVVVKILRQGNPVLPLRDIPEPGGQSIDAGGGRTQPGHNRGA